MLLLPFALDLLFPFPWAAIERPVSIEVEAADGAPLRSFLAADGRWRFPVKIADLPPELPTAFVASEDRRFHRHFGVDPLSVARAAWSDLRAGEIVSGASTIPMQIARMAEPGPRTFRRKVREAFRAFQLELHRSKTELLETYLNLIPCGGNLEGVGAGARFLFGKDPADLSLGEAALLVALPRSPNRYDPTLHPEAARRARDRVLHQLEARGAFPKDRIAAALAEPIPLRRERAPRDAPHLAERAAARAGAQGYVRTTLDRSAQRSADELVRRRIGGLRALGIGNASVVVIELGSEGDRKLVASVGSAGFDETYFAGQVDGTMARRSPGSTLKPFLYALAFDEGRIIPDSQLLDIPTDFAGYVAENYDDRYRGMVSARDALIQSLNACTVRLLAQTGLSRFLDLLQRGGLSTLDRPAGTYGLPLVLGAGEVTLTDLTNLYATLALGGEHRPLHWIESGVESGIANGPESGLKNGLEGGEVRRGKGGEQSSRLLSAEAATLTTEILSDVRRPDLPESWQLAQGVPAIAWKTGTSYGHRDAWALGFSGRFAIGVWVGNFDGRARQGISGSEHAGPLLFDLFRALDRSGSELRSRRGLRLEEVELCAISRGLPRPECKARVRATYIPERTRLESCPIHRTTFVDRETGELLGGDCLATRPHRTQTLEVFPAELVAWWRAQGRPSPEIPAVRDGCTGFASGAKPRIVSPDETTPYHLRRDTPLEDQRIPLIARADPIARKVYWYLDGLLVATGSPIDKLFLPAEAGEHHLVLTDDLGRSDEIIFRVESRVESRSDARSE